MARSVRLATTVTFFATSKSTKCRCRSEIRRLSIQPRPAVPACGDMSWTTSGGRDCRTPTVTKTPAPPNLTRRRLATRAEAKRRETTWQVLPREAVSQTDDPNFAVATSFHRRRIDAVGRGGPRDRDRRRSRGGGGGEGREVSVLRGRRCGAAAGGRRQGQRQQRTECTRGNEE